MNSRPFRTPRVSRFFSRAMKRNLPRRGPAVLLEAMESRLLLSTTLAWQNTTDQWSARYSPGTGQYDAMATTMFNAWGTAGVGGNAIVATNGVGYGGAANNQGQGLLQFVDLFGNGANQIPGNAAIQSATLTLNAYDANAGKLNGTVSLYALNTPWLVGPSAYNTYDRNSGAVYSGGLFGTDGVTPGTETVHPTPDATATLGNATSVTLDVTSSLTAWLANPSANDGWGILAGAGQQMIFAGSGANYGASPRLQVTFNVPPTVATAAAANPSPVAGTATTLSVLGADDGGEPNLTYTWAATTKPAGANPSFSANGTNAAKSSTVTFDKAGNYTFVATIADAQGATVGSAVSLTVNQTLTTIGVNPTTASINTNQTQVFSATAYDQFGGALGTQPSFGWGVTAGGGSVNANGTYTAPASPTAATVQAAAGGVSGTATVNVTSAVTFQTSTVTQQNTTDQWTARYSPGTGQHDAMATTMFNSWGTGGVDGNSLVVTNGVGYGAAGNNQGQGLLQFVDLFGTAANQVPSNATVQWASLTLGAYDPNAGKLNGTVSAYTLTTPWLVGPSGYNTYERNTSATYSGGIFGADGITPGTETLNPAASTVTLSNATSASFDVTTSLARWLANPSLNDGWGLLVNSGQQMVFAGTGGSYAVSPKLQICYTTGTVPGPASASGVLATAVAANQINLTWADNSANETGFKIERATDSGFTQNLTLVTTTAADVTRYADIGLTGNTTYFYRVRATNASGDSVNSNVTSATTPLAVVPNGNAAGLTATPVSPSQINLSWADNSTNETGFKIERALDGAFTQGLTLVTTTAANVTHYADTGLSAATTYYYRVRATNSGTDSANSNTASAITQGATAPAVPSNLSATAVSYSQVNLSWTDNSNNETWFRIERATDSGFTQNLTSVATTAPNVTTYSNTGLAGSTTYFYRVRSSNYGNDSAPSNTASATTPAGAPADYSPENAYPAALFTANRLIDVTQAPYNADKTGAVDATAAIQAAIAANIGRFGGSGNAKPMTLYFPNGTYLISNTLNWMNTSNQWTCSLVLQGESRNGVTIKLANNATGFGDPNNPKAMVVTANRDNGLTGNNAFSNYIYDMTFDTGAGNPGAVGVDFLANNDGGLRDVTIRSGDAAGAGVCGLSMMRDWPGPAFFKDVRVDGFNYGVHAEAGYYSLTFENLTLNNQLVAGFRNEGTVISARNVLSNNAVPAIQNREGRGSGSLFDLLDSTLSGGSSATSAIDNQAGQMLIRNVSAAGSAYASVIQNLGTVVPGMSQTEWSSQATTKLFSGNPGATLNLAIQNTPNAPVDNNFTDWANVMDYGASPDDYTDDAAGIQAAMNSGKPVIYFPQSLASDNQFYTYRVNSTIVVPSTVKRIIGFGSSVLWMNFPASDNNTLQTNDYVFRLDTGAGNQLVIEGLNVSCGQGYMSAPYSFKINGAGTVAIKDSRFQSLTNSAGSGPLFLENNACGYVALFNPENVWMRQLNPETSTFTKVTNVGGNLWILGLKTEGGTTCLATYAGGKSEVFGGSFMATNPSPSNKPAVVNDAASSSVSFYTLGTGGGNVFNTIIQERQVSTTNSNYAFGTTIALYRGDPGASATNYDPFALTTTTAAAVTPTFTTSGLDQWVRADGTLQVDPNNRVISMVDMSGNNHNVFSNVLTNAPTLVGGTHPSVAMGAGGGSTFLESGNTFAVNGGRSVAVVFTTPGAFSGRQMILGQGGSLGIYIDGNQLYVCVHNTWWDTSTHANWGPVYVNLGTLQANTTYSLSAVIALGAAGTTNGTLTVALNHGPAVTVSGVGDWMPWSSQPYFSAVGSAGTGCTHDGGGASSFTGSISELLQYSRPLATDEWAGVQNYLLARYGL